MIAEIITDADFMNHLIFNSLRTKGTSIGHIHTHIMTMHFFLP